MKTRMPESEMQRYVLVCEREHKVFSRHASIAADSLLESLNKLKAKFDGMGEVDKVLLMLKTYTDVVLLKYKERTAACQQAWEEFIKAYEALPEADGVPDNITKAMEDLMQRYVSVNETAD